MKERERGHRRSDMQNVRNKKVDHTKYINNNRSNICWGHWPMMRMQAALREVCLGQCGLSKYTRRFLVLSEWGYQIETAITWGPDQWCSTLLECCAWLCSAVSVGVGVRDWACSTTTTTLGLITVSISSDMEWWVIWCLSVAMYRIGRLLIDHWLKKILECAQWGTNGNRYCPNRSSKENTTREEKYWRGVPRRYHHRETVLKLSSVGHCYGHCYGQLEIDKGSKVGWFNGEDAVRRGCKCWDNS